jgi:hypothetical protein
MTIIQLEEILTELGFTHKGKMSPPNMRVIFSLSPITIIVTRNDGEIKFGKWRDWTFNLAKTTPKDIFKMLDDYFRDDAWIEPIDNKEKYESIKKRCIREYSLKELHI